MRKFLFISLLSLCAAVAGAADVKDAFVAMPDSVLPLLSGINRLDMLDFQASGMKAVVRNRLDGESELMDFSSQSMKIRYTANSEVTIRLYYYRDSVPVICMAHTMVSNGIRDSRIDFYDTRWQKLDASRILQFPTFGDFVRTGLSSDSVAYINRMSGMNSINANLPDDSETIEFTYTGLLLTGEDSLKCVSCLRKDPLVYEWNGKRFSLRKGQR